MIGSNLTEWCPICGGTGEILVERITRRVTVQAGDPAFLAEFRKNIEEIAKLEGAYLHVRMEPEYRRPPFGLERSEQELDYSRVPPDLLIKAQALMDELVEASGKTRVIDAEVDEKTD
jgi:hypothetical protein